VHGAINVSEKPIAFLGFGTFPKINSKKTQNVITRLNHLGRNFDFGRTNLSRFRV
jgi:hypothetical protein